MPTIKLTQPAVEKLKAPPNGRIEYWDKQLPGFGLRISDTGRKSWVTMYRVDRKLVRETLGTTAVIPNVADARERARQSLQKASSGINPVDERRMAAAAQKVAEERAPAATFGAVADHYMKSYVEKNTRPATIKETRRILERDVKPRWDGRPIAEIGRQDISELLEEIAERGAPVQANRTLARLKTLFHWALDEEFITTDPIARIRKVIKERARDRALSEDEIRYFWTGCDTLGWPFGPLFKLLLLTAQRRDEVGTLEWCEIDFEKRTWVIPRTKAKNDRAHEVHLSELAVEIVTELPKIGNRLLFTTNGERPVSGFSKAKSQLDARMLEFRRAESGDEASIDAWILHDLRRTAATGMARLNISPHVVDKVLNHVSGAIRGVAAVYNRYGYLEERKAALEAWGRYVESLVRQTSANVLLLPITRPSDNPADEPLEIGRRSLAAEGR